VAPVFRTESAPRDELAAVLAESREMAVWRAQTLVFQMDARGNWRLTPAGGTISIGSGAIHTGGSVVKFRITPLGVCLAEDWSPAESWDAIACARASRSEPP